MNTGEFDILRSASAGMDAQRSALDLAARNVAASEADGTAFERLVPRYAVASDASDGNAVGDGYEPPEDPEADDGGDATSDAELPVRYLGATTVRGVAPDAVTEMVAVLDAQRAYDADASMFDAGKRLAERTIEMGRLQ
jgi:flagellar basal body rod protein FlgC